ncbi:glycoside hydrolase family 32 protein [Halonatronum saccharophilum]|uniref:glycoside hydrolase family 32 protein n=1 Tax=Halonatronum saccharophilum TaxID=150060 RepID=UPI00048937FF|nr:sucrose-6-phosphate hydrolase [Halonatronum saccharophilum]
MKRDEMLREANKYIEENRDKVKDGYYRLKYHIMPPIGWLNDPNGFVQFKGEYHLFYQFHPFSAESGLKYWGHYKSKDLIDWEELPVALAPTKCYESHGCYSGSAVDNDGEFTLLYTGNVKNDGVRSAYQILASSEDGIEFKKEDDPVIKEQPEGYTAHFRDPKVWKEGDYWYMVIGAQTIEEEGRVLLYRSKDLKSWEYINIIGGSNYNGFGYFGYMWECPDLFSLKGKDVLIFLPQGLEAKGDLYNNIYQAGYVIGNLDYNSGEYSYGEFIELDRGFDFYATQTTLDDKGRRLLIGWMGLPEEDHKYIEREEGWIHSMTIPRVLDLKNNKLIQKPIEELKELRKNHISYNDIILNNEEMNFVEVEGDVVELLVHFEEWNASSFGLKVRRSEDAKEETLIEYDSVGEKLILSRERSGRGGKGIRRVLLEDINKLKLQIFIDRSSIEIFVNEGVEVFSARIYPDKESKGISFFAKSGKVKLKKVEKWDLD